MDDIPQKLYSQTPSDTKIMKEPSGRFYLKLTDSKNLIGEFSNSNCNGNYTESADLDPSQPPPDSGKFSGYYYSTWHDDSDGHESVLAQLKIWQEHKDIFSLEWRVADDSSENSFTLRFRGEGILCDGTLIGDYRSV